MFGRAFTVTSQVEQGEGGAQTARRGPTAEVDSHEKTLHSDARRAEGRG
jgi:hypothetical protein